MPAMKITIAYPAPRQTSTAMMEAKAVSMLPSQSWARNERPQLRSSVLINPVEG